MKIFEFVDYKCFLWHFIENQPKKGRGLVKAIGEYLSIDPSQVSQVLSGPKDFTEEQMILLARYSGLNEIETDYFLALVKVERAGSKVLKDYYIKKRDAIKARSLNVKERLQPDRALTDYEKSIFFSSYLYTAVLLSTSLGEGQTISEIAERFQIPHDKIAEILNFLTYSSLCIEEDGKYKVGTQHTHIERGSPFLARHHHNWRVKALQKTDSLSEQELQFTGPVTISVEAFESVRESLVDVISKSLEKVKDSDPVDIACLNIDWFWLDKK